MPRIVYECQCGNVRKKMFTKVEDITNKLECDKCQGDMQRKLSSPCQKSTMIVDNGVQAKAVELNRNIVDIIEDREKADLKKRGDAVLENLK